MPKALAKCWVWDGVTFTLYIRLADLVRFLLDLAGVHCGGLQNFGAGSKQAARHGSNGKVRSRDETFQSILQRQHRQVPGDS